MLVLCWETMLLTRWLRFGTHRNFIKRSTDVCTLPRSMTPLHPHSKKQTGCTKTWNSEPQKLAHRCLNHSEIARHKRKGFFNLSAPLFSLTNQGKGYSKAKKESWGRCLKRLRDSAQKKCSSERSLFNFNLIRHRRVRMGLLSIGSNFLRKRKLA